MNGISIDLEAVETNILISKMTGKPTAPELAARLKKRNILVGSVGNDVVRLVTHLDVDRAACITAAEALAEETQAA
jgi:threonine aldolase